MKILLRSLLLCAMLITTAFAIGCVSVSYKGKSCPSTETVEVLKNQKEIPAGYEAMGNAVASGPSEDFTREDIEKKLIKRAKSEGADAVMIVLFEEVKTGEEREDEFLDTNPVNTGWGMATNTEGDLKMHDTAVPGAGSKNEIFTFKTIIKAVFLKKKDK